MTDSSSWVCISTTPAGEVTITVTVDPFVFVHISCRLFCRTVSCFFSPSSVGTSTLTAILSLRIQLRESGSIISTLRRQVDRGKICPMWHYVCIHRHLVSKTHCNQQQAETASKFAYIVPFIVYLHPMKSVIINIYCIQFIESGLAASTRKCSGYS